MQCSVGLTPVWSWSGLSLNPSMSRSCLSLDSLVLVVVSTTTLKAAIFCRWSLRGDLLEVISQRCSTLSELDLLFFASLALTCPLLSLGRVVFVSAIGRTVSAINDRTSLTHHNKYPKGSELKGSQDVWIKITNTLIYLLIAFTLVL